MLFQSFKIKSKLLNSRNNCFSDGSLFTICSLSKYSLEELTIRNCHKLSEIGLSSSLSMLTSLKRLDLSFCRQIRDECLIAIFESEVICSKLECLSIRFLHQLTLKGIKPALIKAQALRRLEMSACRQVDLTLCLYIIAKRKNPITTLALQYLPTCYQDMVYLGQSGVKKLDLFCKYLEE